MKKTIGIILALLFINTASVAGTLTGPVAKQLYDLIPRTPLEQVFFRPISIKVLSEEVACSERWRIKGPDSVPINSCIVPNKDKDGRIYIRGDAALSLFEALGKIEAPETVRVEEDGTHRLRHKESIACLNKEGIAEPFEPLCMILPDSTISTNS